MADQHGNKVAREGCDRCICGCKYWENDRCIDCGTSVADIDPSGDEWRNALIAGLLNALEHVDPKVVGTQVQVTVNTWLIEHGRDIPTD